MLDTINT